MTAQIVEPDPMSVRCPKCGEENIWRGASLPPIINVQFVVDERGPHYECNACSTLSTIHQATVEVWTNAATRDY